VAVASVMPRKSTGGICMGELTLTVVGVASEAGRVMFIAFNDNALQRKMPCPGHDVAAMQHFSNPDLVCSWECKVNGNRKQCNSSVTNYIHVCSSSTTKNRFSVTLRVPTIEIFVLYKRGYTRLAHSMWHLLTFYLNCI
jgi:hypothetical protein